MKNAKKKKKKRLKCFVIRNARNITEISTNVNQSLSGW